jgi:hypothetical protein
VEVPQALGTFGVVSATHVAVPPHMEVYWEFFFDVFGQRERVEGEFEFPRSLEHLL